MYRIEMSKNIEKNTGDDMCLKITNLRLLDTVHVTKYSLVFWNSVSLFFNTSLLQYYNYHLLKLNSFTNNFTNQKFHRSCKHDPDPRYFRDAERPVCKLCERVVHPAAVQLRSPVRWSIDRDQFAHSRPAYDPLSSLIDFLLNQPYCK